MEPSADDWATFLSSPDTVRSGKAWFSRARPPDVPPPKLRSKLEQATAWLEGQGLAVEVASLGNEYYMDLVRQADGHRFSSYGAGSSAEEAAMAAVRSWKRRHPLAGE